MPRLRRRDVHPDAPVRRPISAARDLGEPAPPPEPVKAPAVDSPAWLAEAPPRAPSPSTGRPAGSEPRRPHGAARAGLGPAPHPPGLRRRQPPAPAPQVFPEAGDDRLQSAIESLQRLAARGD